MIQNNLRCHSRVGGNLYQSIKNRILAYAGMTRNCSGTTKNTKRLGFSLLEIMIAMALGVLISLGLSKLYLSLKQSYVAQTDLARLQEDGRLAAFILTNNIRMAGYSGCRSGRISDAIHGYTAANPPSDLKNITPNTDVIVIKKADVAITHLTRDVNAPTNTIYVQDSPATKSKRKLFISDCEVSQEFEADNYARKKIVTDRSITHAYKIADTEVARDEETAYFIGKTDRKNIRGKPIYALYTEVNKKSKQELIPGVRNMQIKYVIGGNYYTATQVANWNQVTGVYITLTITSGAQNKPWKMYIALRQRAAQS